MQKPSTTTAHRERPNPAKIQQQLLNEVIVDYQLRKESAPVFTCFSPCTRNQLSISEEEAKGNLTATSYASKNQEANNFSDYVCTTQDQDSPPTEKRHPKRSYGNSFLNFGEL